MKTDKSISGYMISGPPLNCAHFWEHAAPCMEREEEIELSLQWGGQSQVTSKGNSSQQCLGNRTTSCCEPNWRKKKNLKVRKKKIPPKKPTNSNAKKKNHKEKKKKNPPKKPTNTKKKKKKRAGVPEFSLQVNCQFCAISWDGSTVRNAQWCN